MLVMNGIDLNPFYDVQTGTIRVYCRVRPFLQCQTNGQSTVDYIGENGNIMIVNPLKQGKDARKVFSFNKVFGPTVSQGIFLYNMVKSLLFITSFFLHSYRDDIFLRTNICRFSTADQICIRRL